MAIEEEHAGETGRVGISAGGRKDEKKGKKGIPEEGRD